MPPLRTILAFLIAPASFGLLLLLVSLASPSMEIGVWALGFVAMIAYPLAFVVGIPLFLLLTKQGRTGPLIYAGVSLLFSVLLISYFILWPLMLERSPLTEILLPARIGQMAIIAFACFLTVFVFWLIARPDKRAS